MTIETHGDSLKPGSFIQPLQILTHQNEIEGSVTNTHNLNSPASIGNHTNPSSPLKKQNGHNSQPYLSLEQSKVQAFQQLQKQGIIDDNVSNFGFTNHGLYSTTKDLPRLKKQKTR